MQDEYSLSGFSCVTLGHGFIIQIEKKIRIYNHNSKIAAFTNINLQSFIAEMLGCFALTSLA